MQVGLDGVVEGQDHNQKDRAAEPRKVGVEKLRRLCNVFRSEPVALVRKIDQCGGQRRDDPRDAKADDHRKHTDADKDPEKRRFCLPTIGYAAAIEM